MRRRAVVRAVGIGLTPLAGCVDRGFPDGDTTWDSNPQAVSGTPPASTAPGVPSTEDTGLPLTVTLDGVSATGLAERFDVEASVTVLEPALTAEHTARILVRLETTVTRTRTLTYTRERCNLNLVTGRYERPEGARLHLVPASTGWSRTDPDCWVPDVRDLECGIVAMDHDVTVAPDEPLRWTFHLWADPRNETTGGCMPEGTCRFRRQFSSDGADEPLSFALTVEAA